MNPDTLVDIPLDRLLKLLAAATPSHEDEGREVYQPTPHEIRELTILAITVKLEEMKGE